MKILSLLCFVILVLFQINLTAQPAVMSADNGIIKVKLDLSRGGAINYLSVSNDSTNLINIYDEGRYIQQSYYAGNSLNRIKDGQSPSWSPWPWNPIQVGDYSGNRAKILDYMDSGDTLYVKCTPMLWDMDNKPAEAEMEQWTIVEGNVIEVHNKLTCFRTDTIYGQNILKDQELPAVYPISELEYLYYYSGELPFTSDSLSNPEVVNLSSGFWGRYKKVSENWMAFVDKNMHGIGVYNPKCSSFLAGMAGKSGHGSLHASTSYIAPIKKETLNNDSVYEYTYYIIVGTLEEIRAKVYELRED